MRLERNTTEGREKYWNGRGESIACGSLERTWKKKHLIANPFIRYSVIIAVLLYILIAGSSIEVDPERIVRGVSKMGKLFSGFFHPDFATENYVSYELNKLNIGPLGLGGKTTVLGSFINIGNQRASGVRIVSIRPACFVEPRVATVSL